MRKIILDEASVVKYCTGFDGVASFTMFNNSIIALDENDNLLYVINDLNKNNATIEEIENLPEQFEMGKFTYIDGEFEKIPEPKIV